MVRTPTLQKVSQAYFASQALWEAESLFLRPRGFWPYITLS